jgi:CRISPR/Cas system-associated endoribonuclease Cas2
MALYAISYQLNDAKDYPKLWEELERLNAHKVMRSFYFLNLAEDNPQDVCNHFRRYIDDDDMIAIIPMMKRPATYHPYKGTKAWLDAEF